MRGFVLLRCFHLNIYITLGIFLRRTKRGLDLLINISSTLSPSRVLTFLSVLLRRFLYLSRRRGLGRGPEALPWCTVVLGTSVRPGPCTFGPLSGVTDLVSQIFHRILWPLLSYLNNYVHQFAIGEPLSAFT